MADTPGIIPALVATGGNRWNLLNTRRDALPYCWLLVVACGNLADYLRTGALSRPQDFGGARLPEVRCGALETMEEP